MDLGAGFDNKLPFYLLHTGSEERELLGIGSLPVATLPSCQRAEVEARASDDQWKMSGQFRQS